MSKRIINYLLKINKVILIGLVVVLLTVAGLLIMFNNYESKQAFEAALPKRNLVQFVSEETENFFNKLLKGEPSAKAQERIEKRKENLKYLGKSKELSAEAKNLKREIINDPISTNKGDILLHETDGFSIEYISFPDLFFANLEEEPVEKYQKEVESWFLQKGFKKDDLCGLGINFIADRNLRLKVGYEIPTTLSYC